MKKRGSSNAYQTILQHAQSELNPLERFGSQLIHRPTTESILSALEKSIFRSTPLLIAGLVSVLVGLFSSAIAFVFGYHIISFTFLNNVFVISFVVGLIYEYILTLSKHR